MSRPRRKCRCRSWTIELIDIKVLPINEPKLRLRWKRDSWERDVIEAARVQVIVFQELKDLTAKQSGLSDATEEGR